MSAILGQHNVNNRVTPPKDSRDVVNEPLDAARPLGVMVETQHLKTLAKVARNVPTDPIKSTLVEVNTASLIFENNIFESAPCKGVSIKLDRSVAESGAVVVHRCQFLGKYRRKLTPRTAGVES
jgi:hypothetical protein